MDDDGSFWFEFDDEGYNAAADVYGIVYQLSYDGEDIIELGETYDLNGGWSIYGDYYMSDFAAFTIEDGGVYYNE